MNVPWLVVAGFFLWMVVYWKGGLLIVMDLIRVWKSPQTGWDAPLLVLMTVGAMVVTIAALWMSFNPEEGFGRSFFALIGAPAVFSGIGGTFYCRYYLGRCWTAQTKVSDEHQVISSGPYGWVRHPIYTAAIVLYVGMGMVFPVWWNLIAVGCVVGGYIFKAYDEDRYLQKSLTGYSEYAQRVPYRLVPGIW